MAALADRAGALRADPGPGEPRFHRQSPARKWSAISRTSRDLGRMALSRDGHRLRDPEDRRLGNGRQLQDPAHFQRDSDGSPEPFSSGERYSTATAGATTLRASSPRVLRNPGSGSRWGGPGSATTTRWRNPSTASLKVELVHRKVYVTRRQKRRRILRAGSSSGIIGLVFTRDSDTGRRRKSWTSTWKCR